MKQEIIRSEYAPEKRSLWLHTKNGNLVLEAYGNNGWESVGEKINTQVLLQTIDSLAKEVQALKTVKAVSAKLPKLAEDCSKQDVITAITKITKVLVNSGLVQ